MYNYFSLKVYLFGRKIWKRKYNKLMWLPWCKALKTKTVKLFYV